MTPNEFRTITKLTKKYMQSLDLETCKREMIADGLLNTNTKLAKGENMNYGLELLPSVLSGVNLCPNAGLCMFTCLAFSGVGNLFKSKDVLGGKELSAPLKKKARRTFILLNDKNWFEKALISEITYKHTQSVLIGDRVYFRLNVFSDIDWSHITNKLPHVDFYDYTKVWNRGDTDNYKLTFSASEKTDEFAIMEKLSLGENVAMVFNSTKLPETYLGFKVINGDINDDRSTDERGVIVGLVNKTSIGGKNKNSKFLVNV